MRPPTYFRNVHSDLWPVILIMDINWNYLEVEVNCKTLAGSFAWSEVSVLYVMRSFAIRDNNLAFLLKAVKVKARIPKKAGANSKLQNMMLAVSSYYE